jgi:hypothetical protein
MSVVSFQGPFRTHEEGWDRRSNKVMHTSVSVALGKLSYGVLSCLLPKEGYYLASCQSVLDYLFATC